MRTFVGLRSVRPRTEPVRIQLIHWTGGQGGLERLFNTLRTRTGPRTPDGLSVHVGVQADGEHEVWAPDDAVCLHAGPANPFTRGYEVTCPGFPGAAWDVERKRGVRRNQYTDRLHGRRVTMLGYTEAQYEKMRWLLKESCAKHGIPFDYPREKDGSLMKRAMTRAELAVFRGVAGHFHITPGKCDPGTEPFERLLR